MDQTRKEIGLKALAAAAVFILLGSGWSTGKRVWILRKGKPVTATIENVTCSSLGLGCTAWFTYPGADGKPVSGLSKVFRRNRPSTAAARYLPGHEKDLTTAAELVDDDGFAWSKTVIAAALALGCFFTGRWR